MFKRSTFKLFTVLVSVVALFSVTLGTAGAHEDPMTTPALYNGELIDIAVDWEGATACLVRPDVLDTAECFDSEAEMTERNAELDEQYGVGLGPRRSGKSSFLNCSSYASLYRDGFGQGPVLMLNQRNTWHNMGSYNFNQKISSFHIGNCHATFADWNNGQGAIYPLNQTQAGDGAVGMAAGWDNDVSSIRFS